jgi:hypothetical protein
MPYNIGITMRRYHWVSLGMLVLLVTTPYIAHAAGFFGPLIPDRCNCPGSAPDWGCVLQTFQNGMNLFVSLAVIIITIFIALAGFTYMTSSGNPEKRQLANRRILNAVIGLLIVLVAWLLVDSIMKALYDGNKSFGGWNSILAGGTPCIAEIAEPSTIPTISSPTNGAGGTGLPPQTGTGACAPANVINAAASAGINMSSAEAQTLACIARPESACGANTSGATTVGGKSTSASGPWQIILGKKDACHSLTLPACGNLNCSAAYSGGKPKSDPQSQALAQRCQAAVNNLQCSTAAADCLVKHGGYLSAWASDPRSSAQKACINQYAGGG